MKWVLVVLIGGASPVQTDLVFEKLTDCIAAEEQLQQAYAEAYTSWNRRFIAGDDGSERRRYRDLRRAKESQIRKLQTAAPASRMRGPISLSFRRTKRLSYHRPLLLLRLQSLEMPRSLLRLAVGFKGFVMPTESLIGTERHYSRRP